MTDLFDWQEFLYFATKIFKKHEKIKNVDISIESDCRIAISRAYYAVYHTAKDYLSEIQPDFTPKMGEGVHESVINGFKGIKNNKSLRNLSLQLDKLREMRVRADYYTTRYNNRGEDGNVIMELRKAIDYANKINKIISGNRQK